MTIVPLRATPSHAAIWLGWTAKLLDIQQDTGSDCFNVLKIEPTYNLYPVLLLSSGVNVAPSGSCYAKKKSYQVEILMYTVS
jgi:hypothetical protein